MSKVVHRKKRLSSFKLIVLGFAAVIFVGALLLMLPVSSVSGTQTPFHEALFTSVSAVCVTGLVVQDTGSYWSSFGQTVILLLIQTGGLGVITVAVCISEQIHRQPTDQPRNYAFDHNWWHRLSDVGRYLHP